MFEYSNIYFLKIVIVKLRKTELMIENKFSLKELKKAEDVITYCKPTS